MSKKFTMRKMITVGIFASTLAFYSLLAMAQKTNYGVRERSASNNKPIVHHGQTVIKTLSTTSPNKARVHQLGMRHGGIPDTESRRQINNRIKYTEMVVKANPGRNVTLFAEGLERGVEYDSPVEGARLFGLDDPAQNKKRKEHMPSWKAAEKLYARNKSDKNGTLLMQWTEYMQSVQGVRNRQAWEDVAKADLAVVVQGIGHSTGFEGTFGKGPLFLNKAKEENIDIVTLFAAYPAQAMLEIGKAGRRPLHDLTVKALQESIALGLDSGERFEY